MPYPSPRSHTAEDDLSSAPMLPFSSKSRDKERRGGGGGDGCSKSRLIATFFVSISIISFTINVLFLMDLTIFNTATVGEYSMHTTASSAVAEPSPALAAKLNAMYDDTFFPNDGRCYAPIASMGQAMLHRRRSGAPDLEWQHAARSIHRTINERQFGALGECEPRDGVEEWYPGRETQQVKIEVWGFCGMLVDHMDEHLIGPWMANQNLILFAGQKPYYSTGGDGVTKHRSASLTWAKGDSTLPCDSLYGCYWEPLSKCDGTWWWHESERKLPPKKHQKKPLYDTLTAQLRAYHHRHGPLLLRAAVFAWTYRPAKALAARINAVVEPIFSATSNGDLKVSEGGAGNCVAVHLRRGDQCHDKNKVCPPITAFIDAALDFADRYGLTSLFLATDDEDVIKAVVAKASELTVTFNKAIDRSGYAVSKKEGDDPNAKSGKPAYFVEERVARGELSPTPILDILVDVEAASRCSAFVGDGQSHVGEMILLKMAWNLGYVPPFYSVVGTFGTPWSAVENLESVGDFSTFWPMKTFEKNVGGGEKC